MLGSQRFDDFLLHIGNHTVSIAEQDASYKLASTHRDSCSLVVLTSSKRTSGNHSLSPPGWHKGMKFARTI